MLMSCYHVKLFSSLLVYSLDFTVTFVRVLVSEGVNHVVLQIYCVLQSIGGGCIIRPYFVSTHINLI
jgi:hypothetical protein